MRHSYLVFFHRFRTFSRLMRWRPFDFQIQSTTGDSVLEVCTIHAQNCRKYEMKVLGRFIEHIPLPILSVEYVGIVVRTGGRD